MDALSYIPYCGSPPAPGELLLRWNLDPYLLAGLLAVAALYQFGAARARVLSPGRRSLFHAGWLVVAAALVSPLCNLTVALFAARAGQHMLLLLVGAPLLVLGGAGTAFAAILPSRLREAAALRRAAGIATAPAVAAALFAVLLWGWHLPPLYDATLRGDGAYWAMHLSLFAGGLLLWRGLLPASPDAVLGGIGAGFATSVQMSMLGALLTFAGTTWYESHQATAWSWGLSPLADQQLGGLIMWVPGGVVFLAVALAAVGLLLRREERSPAA